MEWESLATAVRGWLVTAVIVAAGAAIGFALHQGREPAPSLTRSVPGVEPGFSETATIVVHVAGHVSSPGLVTLPRPSLVADAVAAAGGALPTADLAKVNLARALVDGEQIRIPGPDPAAQALSGDGRVHLNTATTADLEQLPGVGPVLAERIVAHREANGPFQTVEDLLDVPGIGEAKLASLRESVVVP